jgi:hypothetical protein
MKSKAYGYDGSAAVIYSTAAFLFLKSKICANYWVHFGFTIGIMV